MYLVSYQEIESLSKGLAVSNGMCCGSPETDALDTLQRAIRSRVEAACNIESLTRYTWADTFQIPQISANRPVVLRLTNAFIDNPEGVVIKDSSASAIDCTMDVDQRMGMVELTLPAGRYSVEYASGFEADPTTRVFKKTPDWMHAIALVAARDWLVTTNSGSIPKDVALGDLTASIKRLIHSYVYSRYDRPRGEVIWPLRSCRAVGPAPAFLDDGSYRAW